MDPQGGVVVWDSGAVAPNRGHLTFLLHIPYTNIDQTPIAFKFLDKRTYDTTGVKTVFLKQTSSG
jgi:hypothetical protein